MRLDHIAYRVRDRHTTAKFFREAFGYKVQTEFDIDFGGGKCAKCLALEPPERQNAPRHLIPWVAGEAIYIPCPDGGMQNVVQDYHLAPEIFVSDGSPGSIVGDWVAARGGVGGIHHLAYQVEDVAATMKEWRDRGYAEFTSEEPMRCPGLTQVFTKPSSLTGVIYEFIERQEFGFCKDNVRQLMLSTQEEK